MLFFYILFVGYLYGSLSVLVISLCSVVGAGFMKLSRADVKIYMMGSMLSLAVGCLVADAALHLLPDVRSLGIFLIQPTLSSKTTFVTM